LPIQTNRGQFSPIRVAESGYQGASRGGNAGFDSSVSNMVLSNKIISVLTIEGSFDMSAKLRRGKPVDEGLHRRKPIACTAVRGPQTRA
jgi:hypothetical protein